MGDPNFNLYIKLFLAQTSEKELYPKLWSPWSSLLAYCFISYLQYPILDQLMIQQLMILSLYNYKQ
jgi:hypothetical protein